MEAEVTFGDEFPEPCVFCPTGGNRALIMVLGVQSVFVVLLVAIGIGLFSAMVVAVGLLMVDALVVGARLLGRQGGARTVLPAVVVVLRAVLGALPPGGTEWGTAR